MPSEKVSQQEFAVKILTAHLEKERLSHTYLFSGEKESGKEDLARAFACALNCEEGKYFEICSCGSCRKGETGNHPDIKWIGQDMKQRSLKIEEMRETIGAASFKPYEGKRKVFILVQADRLTPDASNALLKTLEEPPDKTIFILTADSRSNLLETILSRSFEVRLRPLGKTAERESIALELQDKKWEDLLETYAGSNREELKKKLDSLMLYFRGRLQNPALEMTRQGGFVRAMDLVTESKDALESNSNQKIVMSRLAMQLRRAIGSSL